MQPPCEPVRIVTTLEDPPDVFRFVGIVVHPAKEVLDAGVQDDSDSAAQAAPS